MIESRRSSPWLARGGAVCVAALAGFGLSQWLHEAPPAAPAASPAPEAPAAAGNSDVKIPAAYLTASGIAVEPVRNGGVGGAILAAATVVAAPGSEARVAARAAGTITRVDHRLGDTVQAGDVLALVDSLEAASMAAERSVTVAKAELARQTYEREARLFRQGVSPRADMEAAQASLAVARAEAHHAATVAQAAHLTQDGHSVAVVAPLSGRLSGVDAMVGAFVQPQTELFRISAAAALQVQAAVTAADARRIAPGDQATLLRASGAPLAARVHAVTPALDDATRAATVVLLAGKDDSALMVGEAVQVRLQTATGPDGLIAPEEAIQTIGGHDVVFVRTPDGFHAQPVRIGLRGSGVAQIIAGVQAGDPIATRNAFLVKAEMTKGTDEDEE